ncbi:MAG: hypothetical protein ACI84R_003080 [Candidatus Azotimanducaceae bacterium]|jgi:hypothetical protein
MLIFLGLLSGALSTAAYIPYIRDTYLGHTSPEPASWLIWSVLGSIAFLGQVFEGASVSLWLGGVQIVGTIIVFALSIWLGHGVCICRKNCKILACAVLGLILWYVADTAAFALAIIIAINLLGGWVTAVKAYRDPQSETLCTWLMSAVASACAIVSVGGLEPIILAYPVYLFVLNIAITSAIMLGRYRATKHHYAHVNRSAFVHLMKPAL